MISKLQRTPVSDVHAGDFMNFVKCVECATEIAGLLDLEFVDEPTIVEIVELVGLAGFREFGILDLFGGGGLLLGLTAEQVQGAAM